MIYYIVWIIPLIILSCLWAYISNYINTNHSSLLFYFLFFSIPIWPFLARHSNNLLIDGLIYDLIITICYALTFVILGYAKGFTLLNWIGLILTVLGIILIKLPK